MKKLLTFYLILILTIIVGEVSISQDISSIGKQKPIDVSGSLSLRLNAFHTSDTLSRRDPFFWTISGNPTVSLYGITLPFSFSFSQKQSDFRQPFNYFGVSPYYKKITFHAGYRNVYFSDYTLSDHMFLGGGIEAQPSILRLGFVYGRFSKAIEPITDTLTQEYSIPSFNRKGFAAKFGLGTSNNYVDLILLSIHDDSLSVMNTEEAGIAPAENLVLGIKSKQVISKIITLDVDFGFSSYTYDARSEKLNAEDYNIPTVLTWFMIPKTSTEFLTAGKASLGFRLKKFSMKLNYRRVEPGYQSMGAYYLNNDIENITLAPSFTLLKNRLRLNGSIGYKRNNLFNTKSNNTFQKANSLMVSFMPTSKWGVNLNYSNYNMNQSRNYTLVRDTLVLEQFSNNISGNVFFNFGTKTRRQNLSFSTAYMDLSDNSSDSVTNSVNSFNPSVSYRFSDSERKFSWSLSLNANDFKTPQNETFRWGFSGGLNKSVVEDKLNLGFNTRYFRTNLDKQNLNTTWMIGATTGYKLAKSHSLSLSLNYVRRVFAVTNRQDASDFLGNFLYSFNF